MGSLEDSLDEPQVDAKITKNCDVVPTNYLTNQGSPSMIHDLVPKKENSSPSDFQEAGSGEKRSREDLQQHDDDDDDDDDEDEDVVATGANAVPPKKKQGRRQKIEIKLIDEKSRRHITFSKRKAGIMKKAYELSTLTGSEILLIVASNSGHMYTYATEKFKPCLNGGGVRCVCGHLPPANVIFEACLNEVIETPGPVESSDPRNLMGMSVVHVSRAPGSADGPAVEPQSMLYSPNSTMTMPQNHQQNQQIHQPIQQLQMQIQSQGGARIIQQVPHVIQSANGLALPLHANRFSPLHPNVSPGIPWSPGFQVSSVSPFSSSPTSLSPGTKYALQEAILRQGQVGFQQTASPIEFASYAPPKLGSLQTTVEEATSTKDTPIATSQQTPTILTNVKDTPIATYQQTPTVLMNDNQPPSR